MSKLASLLRASMSGGLQLFDYRGKTERSRRLMPIILGMLIGTLMLLSGSAMMTELKKDGAETAILAVYAFVTTIVIVMEGSYKAVDLLFKPRDNDTLLAMPIKRSTIVLARMIKFYLFEMVYCLIFLLPAIIAYAMNVEVGVLFCLVVVTMMILLPVIPIAVACMAGLIIAAITGRFKHKAFWQILLSGIVTFAFVGVVIVINTSSEFDGQMMAKLGNKITEFYYPVAAFVKLVTHFDIWEYLGFVVVNLGVLVLTVLVVSKFCFQVISRLGTVSRITETGTDYSFAQHSQTAAMVRKEITRYFNTPVLLMNTAIGLVFFVVAVGALCLKFEDVAGSLVNSVEDFPLTIGEMRAFLPGVTFAMVAFASLLTCITATMISLEGRAINNLKSLPISGVKVIMTKVLAAMLLIVPITGLGSLVMAVRFQFGLVETLLVLIGVVVMPLVTELIGIIINLKYPRFDADNDTVVVKQSASVMVATFLGLGMVLFTISLTFATVFLAGQVVGLLIMDAIYVIVSLFLYFAIVTRGEERYLKLTA